MKCTLQYGRACEIVTKAIEKILFTGGFELPRVPMPTKVSFLESLSLD
jgi:hypothetical protein